MGNTLEKFSLEGKTAIITGGAGMLGQEYARTLAQAGARVVLFDIVDDPKLSGNNIEYQKVDITNRQEVLDAVNKVGRVDVLINNAALNPVPGSPESEQQFSAYENYPEELWQKELDVNLTGAQFCTQAVVPLMKKKGSGSIINISSTYGMQGPDNSIYAKGKYKSIGYATTKGAMLNFTRAWASYLAGTGVRVNTLTPGGVEAGQDKDFVKKYSAKTILGRMAEKSEYSGAILFLASDASSYMTGSNLIVDGGWTAR